MASPSLLVVTAPARRWSQQLRLLVGTTVAVAVLWLAVEASGGPAVAGRALARTSPVWLLAALLTQWLSFDAAALRMQRLVGDALPLSRQSALGLQLAMNGLWVLAPAAPAEAIAYGAGQLRRRGLDRVRTGVVLALEQWFTIRVFYFVAATNLLWVLATRDFPVGGPVPPLLAVTVLVLLGWTAVLARRPSSMEAMSRAWARLRFWVPRPDDDAHRRTGLMLHATAREVVGPPENRVRLVLLSAASHLFGVLSLMASMRAVGVVIDLDLALLATALALVVSSVPLLPAGLGTVEAAVPALLHWYGAPLAPALAGALVARVVGTLLPALLGALSVVVLRNPTRVPAD